MESLIDEKSKIDRAFESAAMKTLSDFGPSVQTSVLYHLARIQGARSVQETLRDPLRFSRSLETVFSKGALIIEDKIIEAMCENLGLEYEKTKGTFEEKLGRIHDLESSNGRPRLLFSIGALEETMRHTA